MESMHESVFARQSSAPDMTNREQGMLHVEIQPQISQTRSGYKKYQKLNGSSGSSLRSGCPHLVYGTNPAELKHQKDT